MAIVGQFDRNVLEWPKMAIIEYYINVLHFWPFLATVLEPLP
jgi:hypothetical protein